MLETLLLNVPTVIFWNLEIENLDKKGNYCYLFLTLIEDYYQNQVAVTIRYSDYAWMYICKEQ